jgi:hypothetical protein
MKVNYPEFVIRVRLPSSSAYHCSPSGDMEYSEAYTKAMEAAVPPGFAVVEPRLGHKRPVDSEGFTWVLLKLVGEKPALANWMERAKEAEAKLAAMAEFLETLKEK